MHAAATFLLILDLVGTFAFALNGSLTAIRVADVDVVGVFALGLITAVGGGIIRDVMVGAVPPATFSDWRYLAVAAGGALLAFLFSRPLRRFRLPIEVLDAVGLSLFAVTGVETALLYGAGPVQAAILGTVTAVGGGTIRDVLIRRVPAVLSSGLYAVPALIAATIVAVTRAVGVVAVGVFPIAIGAAIVCFLIRLIGIHFQLNAPKPLRAQRDEDGQ